MDGSPLHPPVHGVTANRDEQHRLLDIKVPRCVGARATIEGKTGWIFSNDSVLGIRTLVGHALKHESSLIARSDVCTIKG